MPAGVTMSDVYRGMWPFVAIQILGLLLCLAFPRSSSGCRARRGYSSNAPILCAVMRASSSSGFE